MYRKKTYHSKVPSISVDDSVPPSPGLAVISEGRDRLASPPHNKGVSWEEECALAQSAQSVRRRSSVTRPMAHTPPAPRRTSVPGHAPGRRQPTFVHQDELWLTQRSCRPRCLLNNVSPPQGESTTIINTSAYYLSDCVTIWGMLGFSYL